jgi:hypothetical protein
MEIGLAGYKLMCRNDLVVMIDESSDMPTRVSASPGQLSKKLLVMFHRDCNETTGGDDQPDEGPVDSQPRAPDTAHLDITAMRCPTYRIACNDTLFRFNWVESDSVLSIHKQNPPQFPTPCSLWKRLLRFCMAIDLTAPNGGFGPSLVMDHGQTR